MSRRVERGGGSLLTAPAHRATSRTSSHHSQGLDVCVADPNVLCEARQFGARWLEQRICGGFRAFPPLQGTHYGTSDLEIPTRDAKTYASAVRVEEDLTADKIAEEDLLGTKHLGIYAWVFGVFILAPLMPTNKSCIFVKIVGSVYNRVGAAGLLFRSYHSHWRNHFMTHGAPTMASPSTRRRELRIPRHGQARWLPVWWCFSALPFVAENTWRV